MDPNETLRRIGESRRGVGACRRECRLLMHSLATWLADGGPPPNWKAHPEATARFSRAHPAYAPKEKPSDVLVREISGIYLIRWLRSGKCFVSSTVTGGLVDRDGRPRRHVRRRVGRAWQDAGPRQGVRQQHPAGWRVMSMDLMLVTEARRMITDGFAISFCVFVAICDIDSHAIDITREQALEMVNRAEALGSSTVVAFLNHNSALCIG